MINEYLTSDKTPLLSICIVNWNTRKLLEDCLKSILENTKTISFEVIVVDNASSDGSVSMIRNKFEEVILIENKKNCGFARANNQALRISRGEYKLLLNTDTIVLPNALDKMVEFMEKTPQAGACGPRLLNSDRSWQQSIWTFPTLHSEFVEQVRFNFPPFNTLFSQTPKKFEAYSKIWDAGDVISVDVISAACLMVRRQAVEQAGLMDEDLFLFFEEDDWCHRIKKCGWQLYYLSEPEIIHFVGQSRKQLGVVNSVVATSAFYESGVRYFKRHGNKYRAGIVKQIYTLFFWWRVFWNVISIIFKLIRKKDRIANLTDVGICLSVIRNLNKKLRLENG